MCARACAQQLEYELTTLFPPHFHLRLLRFLFSLARFPMGLSERSIKTSTCQSRFFDGGQYTHTNAYTLIYETYAISERYEPPTQEDSVPALRGKLSDGCRSIAPRATGREDTRREGREKAHDVLGYKSTCG